MQGKKGMTIRHRKLLRKKVAAQAASQRKWKLTILRRKERSALRCIQVKVGHRADDRFTEGT
jgi:hypothetical protein